MAQRGGFGGGVGHGGFGRAPGGAFGRGGPRTGGHHFRGTFITGFGPSSPGFVDLGIPPLSPIPPLGLNAPFATFPSGSRRFFNSGGFWPYAFPLAGGDYQPEYPAGPSVVIVQPPQQVFVQQEAPRPVQSVIREYPRAAAGEAPPQETPSAAEPTAFILALKDGSRRPALAVWIDGNSLHYVDTANVPRQLPLAGIDAATTRKLNQERGLSLYLPGPGGA